MERGSEWRRWDLHVHTPSSFYNNYDITEEESYTDIWDKYIDFLNNVRGISTIGITDYFSIEGYKNVLEYKEEEKLKNFDLILPNIEFRVNINDYKFNYHVIFSDEIDPDKIESDFLQDLKIMDYKGERTRLNKENIKTIGEDVKEIYKVSGDPYKVGCQSIYVSLEDIHNVLNSRPSLFADKYMLIMAGNDWDELSWDGRSRLLKTNLLRDCHAVFSSSPSTIDWMLGKKDVDINSFKEIFGNLKPCLHGSDTHAFYNFCKPDEDRFCWIKANPTFEGLKQVLYEPEDRLRIQKEIPENRKSIYSLKSIEIKDSVITDSLSIKEDKILFNKNLVVITGGKGSGKTAMLDLIANCFEDRCKRSNNDPDENSFVQRIEPKNPDLHVQIDFIGDEVDNFNKKVLQDNFFEDSQITYLPQGKIDKYSSKPSLLEKKIKEIIFTSEKIAEKGCKQHFEKLEEEIEALSRKIYSINNNIFELEHDSSKQIEEQIDHEIHIKEGDFKDKEDEFLKFREAISDDVGSQIDKLKDEEISLRNTHSKLDNLVENILLTKKNIIEFVDAFNEDITDLNSEIKDMDFETFISDVDVDICFNSIDKTLSLLYLEIDKTKTKISVKKSLLEKFEGDEQTQVKLIEELEIINKEKEVLVSKMRLLMEKKEEIYDLEKNRAETYYNMLNKYLEWNNYYKEVIEIFSEDKLDILGGLDFESHVTFNKEKFIELGNNILHSRRINKHLIKIGKKDLLDIAEELESIFFKEHVERSQLEKFISNILDLAGALKDSRNNNDFYNWIFGNYFSLNTNILFDKRSMETLSMGQKGTVLLKLFLSEGDYPLIIDQPEDNLDNKFIYKELVGAFKRSKRNRQIIIATNNANLVVNADAEQVIIAEFIDNELRYRSGSLEDDKIRNDLMHILEGGKEAFKEREEKYGI